MRSFKNFTSTIFPSLNTDGDSSLHIALLMGGMSSEREVSLSSGKSITAALAKMGYKVTPIDVGRDIALVLDKLKPDLVFNALHGTYGEDGCIPGMLEIMGIPYTHSGVLASAIALDKELSQDIFIKNGIKCPKRRIIKKDSEFPADPFPRPYIIKPLNQGSSVGIMTVFDGDDYDAHSYEFEYSDRAIVEEFITGREIQVALVQGRAIGALEIVPLKSRIYDYEAKYTKGMARHICPAELSEENTKKIMRISEQAYELIGCKGIARAEFRYNELENEFYFLEINTHPGFTELSIVPEIAEYNGMSFEQLLQLLIEEAMNCYVEEAI